MRWVGGEVGANTSLHVASLTRPSAGTRRRSRSARSRRTSRSGSSFCIPRQTDRNTRPRTTGRRPNRRGALARGSTPRVGVQPTAVDRRPADAFASRRSRASSVAVEILADVIQRQSCAALIERTVDAFGCIDVMVNNAGVELVRRADEHTDEDWRTPWSSKMRVGSQTVASSSNRPSNACRSSAYQGAWPSCNRRAPRVSRPPVSAKVILGVMVATSVAAIAIAPRPPEPAAKPAYVARALERPWLTREAAAQIVGLDGGLGPIFSGAELAGP
ncbi:MAG: SDR family NAD(P)-dependent oxidoreductase, partial [Myxococcales bacterium]|nr:SDR family NAD(P)-dependent oxidoreductase [Myxococcales bacterium]